MPWVAAFGAWIASAVGYGAVTVGMAYAIGTVALVAIGGALTIGMRAMTPKPGMADQLRGQQITSRSPDAARQIIYGQTKAGGVIIYPSTTDSTDNAAPNDTLHLIIAVAGHEVQSIEEIWMDDQAQTITRSGQDFEVTGGELAGAITGRFLLGTTAAQPLPALTAVLPSEWTVDHKLQGIAGAYVALEYDQDKFTGGLPNISLVVKGKKVYDPRTGLTAWSDNPALIAADWLMDTIYGFKVPAEEIDWDFVSDAADVCDELVDVGGTPTVYQKRYTLNVRLLSSAPIGETMETILASMAGRVARDGDKWLIRAGAWETPHADAITERDLVGPISVDCALPSGQSCNVVRGRYMGPETNYQPADFPPVGNATYLASDGGVVRAFEMTFPGTDNGLRAQRLAKIQLEEARQEITVRLRCRLVALKYSLGGNVALTLARYGWSEKPFRMVDRQIIPGRDANGNPFLSVEVILRETASTIWDWNHGEATVVDPAPNTTLPNPRAIPAPSNLDLTWDPQTLQVEGTFSSAVSLQSNAGFRHLVEWREEGVGDWIPLPDLPGGSLSFRFPAAKSGATYEARVRTMSTIWLSRTAWDLATVELPSFDATFSWSSPTPAANSTLVKGEVFPICPSVERPTNLPMEVWVMAYYYAYNTAGVPGDPVAEETVYFGPEASSDWSQVINWIPRHFDASKTYNGCFLSAFARIGGHVSSASRWLWLAKPPSVSDVEAVADRYDVTLSWSNPTPATDTDKRWSAGVIQWWRSGDSPALARYEWFSNTSQESWKVRLTMTGLYYFRVILFAADGSQGPAAPEDGVEVEIALMAISGFTGFHDPSDGRIYLSWANPTSIVQVLRREVWRDADAGDGSMLEVHDRNVPWDAEGWGASDGSYVYGEQIAWKLNTMDAHGNSLLSSLLIIKGIYGSVFSAGADGWAVSENAVVDGNVDGIGTLNDCLRGYANAVDSGSHSFYRSMSLVAGKKYRTRFRYFLPAGQSNVEDVVFLNYDTTSWIPWTTLTLSEKDAWTWVDYEFTAANTGTGIWVLYLKNSTATSYAGANSPSDDLVFLRDFTLTQLS